MSGYRFGDINEMIGNGFTSCLTTFFFHLLYLINFTPY